ncbi:MAG: oligosaccharide flippase family protein [Salinivirgaceae bacterium]|nr:oligosaccharide flippase family protein [Salinivirgaceae bacterium]
MAKHSIVYAIGNLGAKFIGLLLIPLYTNPNLLSTEDYGVLAVLEASLQLLVGILSFSIASSFSRWYWDKDYVNQQKSIFFTSLLFLILIIIPTVFALSYFSNQFSQILFNSINFALLIKLTICTAGIQVLNNFTLTLLRLKSKSVLSTGVQIFKFLGLLLLIIWGLKYKGLGLIAIWQAYLIVESLIVIILLPVIVMNSFVKIQFAILKDMLSYGLPLMLASLSGVILAVTDRYMLNSMQGLERTAIYSVGYKISNTLKMLITSSLSLALLPLQMKKIGTVGSEAFFSKVMKYSSFLFAVALLGLSLFSLEVLKLVTGSAIYWEAYGVVAIISFAWLFGQLKSNALIGITIMKRTKITGLLIFITSMLNIGLNMFLIPIWDIYGAAFATLISQIFFFISVYIAAQRIHYIPYELRNTIVLIAILAIYVIVGFAISELDILVRLGIKALLLISYPVVLYFFNYFDIMEKKNIKQLIDTWRKPGKFKENLNRFLE